jgi:hypothetical protein
MDTASLTAAEMLTSTTLALLHPRTIAEHLVALVPHVLEPILVNVTLNERLTQFWASRNSTVTQYARHGHSGSALCEIRPNVALEAVTQVAFLARFGFWHVVIGTSRQYEFIQFPNFLSVPVLSRDGVPRDQ